MGRTGPMENLFLIGPLHFENRVITTQIMAMILIEGSINILKLRRNSCLPFDNHPSVATFSSGREMHPSRHLTVYRVIPKIDFQSCRNRILACQTQLLIPPFLTVLVLPLHNQRIELVILDSKKKPFPGLTVYTLIFLRSFTNQGKQIDNRDNLMGFVPIQRIVYIPSRLVSLRRLTWDRLIGANLIPMRAEAQFQEATSEAC